MMSSSALRQMQSANVRVVARIRPPPTGSSGSCIRVNDDGSSGGLMIRDPNTKNDVDREFSLDRVFGPKTTQFALYDELVNPCVEHVLEGFHSCCFAYGQTGSGKTYSMLGEQGDVRGMIPRAMESLFKTIQQQKRQRKFVIWVSFLEIYLDQVRDLGRYYVLKHPEKRAEKAGSRAPSRSSHASRPSSATSRADGGDYETENLPLKEAPDGKVYVKGLSEIPISTLEDVQAIIREGMQHRETHETAMNPVSSRSHTVFTVTVTSHDIKNPEGDVVTGTLNLIDLAGSERLGKSQSEGKRLQEAKTINKSLAALGNVVVSLVQGVPHVPYRDSKLTRLLQASLGGNSFTTVLVTLNPDPAEYAESLNTLQFAFRCRHVQNQPKVNYIDNTVRMQEKRIQKLLGEISDLNQQVATLKNQVSAQQQAAGQSRPGTAAPGGGLTPLGRIDTISSMSDLNVDENVVMSTSSNSLAGMRLVQEKRAVEEKMKETTRVLETVAQDKRHLQAKIKKKAEDFKAVQQRVRESQDKYVQQIDTLRQKISELTNELEVNKLDFVHAMNAKAKEHEDELNHVAVNNQRLLKENLTQLQDMMKNAKVSSEDRLNLARKVAEARKETEEEWKARLKELDDRHEATRTENKKKYEFFLESKSRELRDTKRHYTRQIKGLEQDIEDLQAENQYLHALADDYNQVMLNLEKGIYPMKEKNGVKGFQLPAKVKKSMDPSRLPFSKRIGTKKFQNLRRILEENASRQSGDARGQLSNTAPVPPSARPPTRGTSTPRTSTTPRTASLNASLQRSNSDVLSADLSEMTKDDLRAHVQELRDRIRHIQPIQVKGEEKARVREEVLNELADHQLIAYVRQLEGERDRYYQLTKDERARSNALRVALEARERLLAKRTGSATTPRGGNRFSQTARPSTAASTSLYSNSSRRSSSRPRTAREVNRAIVSK
eukprot:TRINITY_DN10842_c0_g1_i1.p1 TRINITY_DN10842_c0_g1~~TRINITY_DN10842_c0_g1_i1.p1  ORF type:complete len:946 (-),score=206.20 TRINITY_DN10842_c0_g1_i1:49-2886(-)